MALFERARQTAGLLGALGAVSATTRRHTSTHDHATDERRSEWAARRIRRGDGRLQLFGRGHRQGAPRPRAARCGHSPGIPSGPAEHSIDIHPLDFDDPVALAQSLRGATTLYNTYWVRFPHGRIDHDAAVANCRTLFYAARDAGVRTHRARLDHPSEHHVPLPLFPGKGRGGEGARRSGRLLRRAPPRHPLRRGRRPSQQHRLAPAPPAGVRGGRSGRLPHPTHPRRRPGPPERDARLAARHRGDRCGGARASDVHGTGLTDQGDRRQPRTHRQTAGAVMPVLSSALGLVLRDVLLSREEYSPWRRASPTPMAPPPGR